MPDFSGTVCCVFFIVSLAAVILATSTSWQNATENQSVSLGPQAQVGQGNVNKELINNFSHELQMLYDTLNASIKELYALRSELKQLTTQTQYNFSDVLAELGAMGDNISSHIGQLQYELTKAQSNITSVANQVISLQSQLQSTQNGIVSVEDRATNLGLVQNGLQNQFNMTQSDVTLASHQITSLQNQLHTIQGNVGSVNRSVTNLQGQLSTTQTNVTTLNIQVGNLQYQLSATQTDLASVSSRVTGLQTSVNNHLSSPGPVNLYQNCHQDTTSCSISSLINDNRRLLCTTSSLEANITVGQRVIMYAFTIIYFTILIILIVYNILKCVTSNHVWPHPYVSITVEPL